MNRIQGHMTIADTVFAMSEGHPGAIRVLTLILTRTEEIDPDAADGFLHLLDLDMFEIYGSRIWMLYKDVCGQDLVNTIGMIRAVQCGLLPIEILNHAIDNRGEGLDVEGAMQKVRAFLPAFAVEVAA